MSKKQKLAKFICQIQKECDRVETTIELAIEQLDCLTSMVEILKELEEGMSDE